MSAVALPPATDALDALNNHCVACHSGRGSAPFRFDSLDGILRSRLLMRALIEDGTMPPSLVAKSGYPIAHDRALDDSTKQVLLRALATPTEAREAFAQVSQCDAPEICDERLRFSPTAAWIMPASGGMRLRTYLIDLPHDSPARVRGFQATSPRAFGASPIRVIACAPDPERSLAILSAPNENGVESMGNVGRTPSGALGMITRVAPSFTLPEGFSFDLPKGSLTMETTSEAIGKCAEVSSELAWIESRDADTRVVRALAMTPRRLRIPSGDTLLTADTLTVARDLDLVGVLVKGGAFLRSIRLESSKRASDTRVLFSIPDFRLALSEPWFFETPVAIDRDERITATFGFDNTSANPQQPHDPPHAVVAGLPPEGEDSVLILLVADRTLSR